MKNNCELCGHEIRKVVILNDDYQAYLCAQCDLLSTEAGHEEAQRNQVNLKTYELEDRIYIYYTRKKEFNNKYEYIYQLIDKNKRNGSVKSMLEIGSNIGYFANFIKRKGIAIETVEINDNLRSFQQTVYGINSVDRLEKLSPNKLFDVIIMMDVLEHIPRPVDFLKNVTRYLAEDGIIFLQFPNKNSLAAKLAGKKWGWWSAPDHLYHFSESAVAQLANKAGLEIQRLMIASPLVDDLISMPIIGKLFYPLLLINRFIPVNLFINFKQGSLLQVILKRAK